MGIAGAKIAPVCFFCAASIRYYNGDAGCRRASWYSGDHARGSEKVRLRMRTCPVCGATYQNHVPICAKDGAMLVTARRFPRWVRETLPIALAVVAIGAGIIFAFYVSRSKDERIKTEQEARDNAAREQEERNRQALEQSARDEYARPTWTDPDTGLIWTKSENSMDVNWKQATDYCQGLRLAGNSDWRLPTIEELQGIYDPYVDIPGRWTTGSSVTWHVKGNLRLSGWHWSSSRGAASGEAWRFYFDVGERYSSRLGFSSHGRALCVRRSGE